MSVKLLLLKLATRNKKRTAAAVERKGPAAATSRPVMIAFIRKAGVDKAIADRNNPISGWYLYQRTGAVPMKDDPRRGRIVDQEALQKLEDWTVRQDALDAIFAAPFAEQVRADYDETGGELQGQLFEAFTQAYDAYVDAHHWSDFAKHGTQSRHDPDPWS